ncbi:MAG: L,D-transpeptidase family protein [Rhizobiales bacterium]|nr:L,D-transpeptidase family protein [Hyphomicrobiales bacterium]
MKESAGMARNTEPGLEANALRHFAGRRGFLVGSVAVLGALLTAGWTTSRRLSSDDDLAGMKPGDYFWDPERAPQGEVVMIVSVPDQRVAVYRGGVRMAVATCSTGRKGHATPTGVFTILQKDADHVSSTYKGAAMPFMERLTWSGIALHAGNLPGYPASHGCVRLPLEFAKHLFSITHLGVVVIIADAASEPIDVVHPGMMLPGHAREEAEQVVRAAASKTLPPERRDHHGARPAKVLVSVADRTVTLLEDGHVVAKGPAYVRDPQRPVGNHVFVLREAHEGGAAFVWMAVAYAAGDARAVLEAEVIDRITTDQPTADALHTLMHPGLTMVVTDQPAPDVSRSDRGFVIATHHEPEGWQTRIERN